MHFNCSTESIKRLGLGVAIDSPIYKMARVTVTITKLVYFSCWVSFQLTFAQLDTSGSESAESSSNSLNTGEATKPGSNSSNINNNSVGGFSPITRFYPLFGYSSSNSNSNNNNPNNQNYNYNYDGQHLNHHQGQGYYPPHSHQHPNPSYLSETGNYNYGNPKGLLYPNPIPFGYYPPNYGTSTTDKPLSSTYPIHTTLGGSTTGYPPFPTSHAPHYPYVHGHNFGHAQAPVIGGGYYNDGFDVGTLPQQVRVPGTIKVAISGKDAEITCEFPKYLILIQGIYWHHKYNDPFGTYYDAQNGYGARVTVQAIDQWKSALYIRDYTVDDFGTYRCISAAVLPAEAEPHRHPQNPYTFATRSSDPGSATDRMNTDRNIPTNSETPPIYEFESSESKSTEDMQPFTTSTRKPPNSRYLKNSRKMKFPTGKSKTRFRRQTDYNELSPATESSNFEMANEETTYDPFFASENTVLPKSSFLHRNNYYYPESVVHNSYHHNHDQSTPNYQHLSNPYATPEFQSYLPQYLPHKHPQNPTIVQPSLYNHNPNPNPRHLLHYGYGPYFPGFGFGSTSPSFPPSNTATPAPTFGLQIPYYKPSYSYFTVYQEVSFQPPGVAGRQTPIISTTPYSNFG